MYMFIQIVVGSPTTPGGRRGSGMPVFVLSLVSLVFYILRFTRGEGGMGKA